MHKYSLFALSIISFLFIACTPPELTVDTYALGQPPPQEGPSPVIIPDDLTLASGDILLVDVWGQDKMEQQVTLDSAGYIYYLLIGKVKASGLTIDQLQAVVTRKLSHYYVDPKVSIIPETLAGQRYYILGEVESPGKFTIESQTAVLEAVASAGGPNQDAADLVILLRKDEETLQVFSIPLQYSDLTANNVYSVTMQVKADDILYLPPSNIADVERFMVRLNNILNPLLSLERGILYWPALVDALGGSSGEVLVQ